MSQFTSVKYTRCKSRFIDSNNNQEHTLKCALYFYNLQLIKLNLKATITIFKQFDYE